MHAKLTAWYVITEFRLHQLIRMWLHTGLKKPLAFILVYAGILLRILGSKKVGLNLILKGRRVDDIPRATSFIRKIIHDDEKSNSEFRALLLKSAEHSIKDAEDRILILKLPMVNDGQVIEKGAVIIKFSETFPLVYFSLDVVLLFRYFRVILEPSSSGYSAEEILVWTMLNPEKVIVLTPDEGDFRFLSELDTNLIPVNLGAADWVNPKIFHKIHDVQKEYDVIYVANFNPVKRVDRYIRAIVRISRKKHNFQAALVCAGHGSSQRAIMAMLKSVNEECNIAFFSAMPQPKLNKLFNQSKVNVLLSLKEGANKGLSEGMFAGTPALLLAENVGVNRANINDQTGKIIPDEKLEEALVWFSEHYHEFASNDWAMRHISPVESTLRLSQVLEKIELSEGRQWTSGLLAKANQPELSYFNVEDQWLFLKRAELLEKFSAGGDIESIECFLGQLQDLNIKKT